MPPLDVCARGLAQKDAGGELRLTPAGLAMRDRVVAARRKGLADMLARWQPEQHPDVLALIERMRRRSPATCRSRRRRSLPRPRRGFHLPERGRSRA